MCECCNAPAHKAKSEAERKAICEAEAQKVAQAAATRAAALRELRPTR